MPAVRPAFRPQVESLEAREVPSFGTGGVVTADLPADVGNGPVTALQADGKIVTAVGNKVARFNADGSPDTTFNGTGVRTITGIPGNLGAIYDVEVMSDGQVVVGGIVGVGDGRDFYLERFLPDGTPDPSFSGDGVVVTGFKKGGGARDSVYGIALQGDGKVVAVGEINGLGQWGVARFNANGSLDSSFGSGGKAWIDFGAEVGLPYTVEWRSWSANMALDAAGRIVVDANLDVNGPGPRLAVARLTPNGTLDATFSGNGLLAALPPGGDANLLSEPSLAVQADGKVVVTVRGAGGLAVGRFNSDGTADATFDGDGWRQFTFSPTAFDANVTDILVQPDGKILVAGWIYTAENTFQSALARFNPDGSFDV